MESENKNPDFIKEQYAQYWEMIRQHSGFSWQIPATGIVAIIAFISLDPANLIEWTKTPLIPAMTFLLVGFFSFIMLIHHRRNNLFVRYYEHAVAQLEKEHGEVMEIHHFQITPKLKGLSRISSTTSLSVFLLFLTLSSISVSVYFFVQLF